MFFFFIVLSFLNGIIFGNLFSLEYSIFVGILLMGFLLINTKESFPKILFCIAVYIFGISITENSHQYRYNNQKELFTILQKHEEKLSISGTVTQQLYQNDRKKTFRLQIETIDTNTKTYNFSKSSNIGLLVEIPKNLTLHSGDTILFSSKIQPIFEHAHISEFKGFEKYSWLKEVYGKASPNSFKRIPTETKTIIGQIKDKVHKNIFDGFPRETSALLLGITIGDSSLFSSEANEKFKNSGLTHILVVSGSNIAFVILILSFILKYFPLNKIIQYVIIGFFLLCYGSLVGWDMPVIRATIMGIIAYIGIHGGYKIYSISILLLIGSILLIFEPLLLLYDASFGLSFGATLGILVVNKPIEKFLQKFSMPNWIITSISVTLSATIGSLGILLYHFGSFSFLGIIANIFIGGIMGLLLILTTFYITASFFLPKILLFYYGYCIYCLSEYIFWVSDTFGKLPPTTISEKISIPIVFIIYFSLFAYIIDNENKNLIMNQRNHQH